MNVIDLKHIDLKVIDLKVINLNCITVSNGGKSGEPKEHTYYILDDVLNIITDESSNRIIYKI